MVDLKMDKFQDIVDAYNGTHSLDILLDYQDYTSMDFGKFKELTDLVVVATEERRKDVVEHLVNVVIGPSEDYEDPDPKIMRWANTYNIRLNRGLSRAITEGMDNIAEILIDGGANLNRMSRELRSKYNNREDGEEEYDNLTGRCLNKPNYTGILEEVDGESWDEVNERYIIQIKEGNGLYCFDIRELARSIETDLNNILHSDPHPKKPMNPYTRTQFSGETLIDIRDKIDDAEDVSSDILEVFFNWLDGSSTEEIDDDGFAESTVNYFKQFLRWTPESRIDDEELMAEWEETMSVWTVGELARRISALDLSGVIGGHWAGESEDETMLEWVVKSSLIGTNIEGRLLVSLNRAYTIAQVVKYRVFQGKEDEHGKY